VEVNFKGVRIADNGKEGIKIDASNVKFRATDMEVTGNETGISINTYSESSFDFEDVIIANNILEGISITDWSQKIDDAKDIVVQSNDLNLQHTEQLILLLEELKKNKDDQGAVKKTVKAISSVSVGVASGTIVAVLKHLAGI
jgi:hypothetical protein